MPAPIDFPAKTVNTGLPLLFAGQAQKEFFVNQALALVDALLLGGIVGSTDAPPTEPAEGDVYRVTPAASGEWTGAEDALAVRIAGGWHLVAPKEGMVIFDRAAGQVLVYRQQWETASAPPAASGGTVVDAEARAAINALIGELGRLGIVV